MKKKKHDDYGVTLLTFIYDLIELENRYRSARKPTENGSNCLFYYYMKIKKHNIATINL